MDEIDDIFDAIEDDASKACSMKEDNSPKAKMFRSQLLELIEGARERFKDEVLPDLEKARRLDPEEKD